MAKKNCLLLLLMAARAISQVPLIKVPVDLGPNQVLFRPMFFAPVPSKVAGIVKLRLTLSPTGAVVSAEALSGPEVSREIAIKSAQQWKFVPKPGPARVIEATVFFDTPPKSTIGFQTGVLVPPPPPPAPPPTDLVVERIEFRGVSAEVQHRVLSAITLHVGDTFTPEVHGRTQREVRGVEGSLVVLFTLGTSSKGALVVVQDRATAPGYGLQPPK